MAIASYKPGQRPEVYNEIPKILPKKYNGIVQDNRYIPQESLLAYVDGMRWTVDYYCQILGDSLNVQMLDSTQPGLYQQYSEVKNLVLIVDQALSSTQDTQNNRMIVTGSAYVTPNIVPNTGDVFVANTGDGNLGLFNVTSSVRKTYMTDSVFEIEYMYLEQIGQDSERYQSLISKVATTSYYTKIYENNNRPSLVISQQYENVLNYQDQLLKIYKLFFKSFFNLSFNTLLVPGQEPATILDYFLLRTIKKIVNTDDAPNIERLNVPNVQGDPYLQQPTIWNALLEQDINVLSVANQQMAPCDIYQFNGNPYLESAKYSFIDYIIYPVGPDQSLFVMNPEYPKGLSPLQMRDSQIVLNGTQINTLNNTYTDVNTTIPLIYSVLVDEYYVLSGNFYAPNSTTQMSILEILVSQYLNRQSINTDYLNAILNSYLGWTRLDQFYYLPIIVFILKNVLKNY